MKKLFVSIFLFYSSIVNGYTADIDNFDILSAKLNDTVETAIVKLKLDNNKEFDKTEVSFNYGLYKSDNFIISYTSKPNYGHNDSLQRVNLSIAVDLENQRKINAIKNQTIFKKFEGYALPEKIESSFISKYGEPDYKIKGEKSYYLWLKRKTNIIKITNNYYQDIGQYGMLNLLTTPLMSGDIYTKSRKQLENYFKGIGPYLLCYIENGVDQYKDLAKMFECSLVDADGIESSIKYLDNFLKLNSEKSGKIDKDNRRNQDIKL